MSRFIRVLTVCGAGVGSCILIKMSTEEALENLGLEPGKDFECIVTGVHEAKSMDFDICVTQGAFSKEMKDYARENDKKWKIIDMLNLTSVKEIQEKIAPAVKELRK